MITTTAVWCDARYGGSPLKTVKISIAGDNIQFSSDTSEITFYFNNATGLIDFKNRVLTAYESWDRKGKRDNP